MIDLVCIINVKFIIILTIKEIKTMEVSLTYDGYWRQLEHSYTQGCKCTEELIVKRMLEDKIEISTISRYTDLTVEEIKEIQEKYFKEKQSKEDTRK